MFRTRSMRSPPQSSLTIVVGLSEHTASPTSLYPQPTFSFIRSLGHGSRRECAISCSPHSAFVDKSQSMCFKNPVTSLLDDSTSSTDRSSSLRLYCCFYPTKQKSTALHPLFSVHPSIHCRILCKNSSGSAKSSLFSKFGNAMVRGRSNI